MTIRPVDLQTLIPKLPEVQKARNVESEIEKNNLNINIHKEQQQQEKISKQVIKTEKNHGAKVDREKQKKEGQGKQEKKYKDGHTEDNKEHAEESNRKALTKIDIRI